MTTSPTAVQFALGRHLELNIAALMKMLASMFEDEVPEVTTAPEPYLRGPKSID